MEGLNYEQENIVLHGRIIMLKCDMFKDCKATVSYIDTKGYLYCAIHGVMRKHHVSCRKLKSKEIERLREGLPLLTKTQLKFDNILDLCAESEIEIVSHGLAPNPNGFCYERGEKTTEKQCAKLEVLLNALTLYEQMEFIKQTF